MPNAPHPLPLPRWGEGGNLKYLWLKFIKLASENPSLWTGFFTSRILEYRSLLETSWLPSSRKEANSALGSLQ